MTRPSGTAAEVTSTRGTSEPAEVESRAESATPDPTRARLLIPAFVALLGTDRVITERAQLRTYECDGLAVYKVTPAVVVLPRTAEEVRDVVRLCVGARVPYVARGSGTGLSGGALPAADGVRVVTREIRQLVILDV